MLTPRELVLHLLSRGFVSARDVFAGDVKVVDRSRHNRNFQVAIGRSKGYFVKQARATETTLDVEAEVYRRPRERPLARYFASFRDYDRQRRVLVLQLLRGGENLGERLKRRGRISQGVAADLGRAIATIHRSTMRVRRPPAMPWVLSLPRPSPLLLAEISAGNLELLRIVQQSKPVCRELTSLARSWRERSLLHNDLRLDNCIVSGKKIRIVDWELAGWGEPSWDVGCVLAEFLTSWVRSMQFIPGLTPAQLVRGARLPLIRLQPAMRSLWRGYVSARAFPKCNDFLLRAVRFAGARLIGKAYECMAESPYLTPHGVALLQLSANVITQPRESATTLFGISTDDRG